MWDWEKWFDHITDIDYKGYKINLTEYGESRKHTCKKGKKKGKREFIRKDFWFLTDMPVTRKNIADLVERGMMRWKIENEGFNVQKKHGYGLEHLYSGNYQAVKNHYYLIQIGHMISQIMEAWEKLWGKARQSREQKHRRLLESWKGERLKECMTDEKVQIRFEW